MIIYVPLSINEVNDSRRKYMINANICKLFRSAGCDEDCDDCLRSIFRNHVDLPLVLYNGLNCIIKDEIKTAETSILSPESMQLPIDKATQQCMFTMMLNITNKCMELMDNYFIKSNLFADEIKKYLSSHKFNVCDSALITKKSSVELSNMMFAMLLRTMNRPDQSSEDSTVNRLRTISGVVEQLSHLVLGLVDITFFKCDGHKYLHECIAATAKP